VKVQSLPGIAAGSLLPPHRLAAALSTPASLLWDGSKDRDRQSLRPCRQLEVPVYLLVGRDDVNAMAALTEDYYNVL
jgi:hypothetical protein